MTVEFNIGIGTVGWGLWFSYDQGQGWKHIPKHVDPEGSVRTLVTDPTEPHRILAGVDYSGLYQSVDGGRRWEPLSSAIDDRQIWSLGLDPVDADRIYVGTRPGGYRSTDGGTSFEPMAMGMSEECPIGTPRTTNMVVDPSNHSQIWAGVEVDGVYHSADGGTSWEHHAEIGPSVFHGDVHGLALRTAPSDGAQAGDDDIGAVMVTTPFGLAETNDAGQSWQWREFEAFELENDDRPMMLPSAYCRGIFSSPTNPDVILIGCGDYIPGQIGGIQRSIDGGKTWSRVDLPETPNSTIYWMGMHREVPGVVVATSILGQAFLSRDDGESWVKLGREFGHVRSVCVAPAA